MRKTTTFGMNRRAFIGGMASTTAAVSTGALAQDKPSRLVISTYGGDYGQWMKETFEVPFTAKTGIGLDHDIGENPARFAKLRTFQKQPRFQLITLQDRYLFQSAQEGLLEDIDYANVPNAADVGDAFKTRNWLAYSYVSIGIIYNSEKVKTPPRNWEDLLSDQFKGRIFIDDFNHFGLHIVLAIAKAKGGGYQNIQPGLDVIKQIKDRLNPRFISTSQEGMKLLDTGEVDVAMWQSARAFTLKAQGKPIEYSIPDTGDVAVAYGSGIVKNANAKSWGETYLNGAADPALQAQFAAGKIIAYPTNKKTQLPPSVAALLKRPENDKLFAIDYAEVLPRLADWTKLWNRMIAG
jgi:putative spermidine/putrescine transport system substrate-binding protein